jgi:hypothetical protein
MRKTDEALRTEIYGQVMAEVREAIDNATDFESFQDSMSNPDSALPNLADVKNWTPEEINANWASVSAALEGSRFDNADDFVNNKTGAPRLSNGQGALNPHLAGVDSRPLDLAAVRRMSEAEINANWSAVQQVLARGAAA